MKQSDFEQIIQMQFDSLVKCIVRDTVKNYRKQIARREKHELPFCDIIDFNIEHIGTLDEYEMDAIYFEVMGLAHVRVDNESLATVLKELSEKKRQIMLMFYFLEISDAEIGRLLSIDRKTSFRNRQSALKEIKKKLLQEE